MMGRTHLALGLCFGGVTAAVMPTQEAAIICLGSAVIGSILPDLDHPKSKLGRRVRPLSDLLYMTLGHRGGSHSAAFMALCVGVIFLISWPAALGLGVGIGSHLLSDAISYGGQGRRYTTDNTGIPIAWPISQKKTGIRLVYVDGVFENLVVLPGALIAGVAALSFF